MRVHSISPHLMASVPRRTDGLVGGQQAQKKLMEIRARLMAGGTSAIGEGTCSKHNTGPISGENKINIYLMAHNVNLEVSEGFQCGR